VPPVGSPDVQVDRRVTFRLRAPKAEDVRLTGSDIPGVGQGLAMVKDDEGVFAITVGPLEPGAYRYVFDVNGVPVVDPRNPAVSQSNATVWSLVVVPGSDVVDMANVPHGAVAAVTYYSTALGTFRRLHVYTPPGYQAGRERYPVLYLLHGAGDSDDSWSSVGRAGFILDNLIAAKRARPMLVVMPAGHVPPSGRGGVPPSAGATPAPAPDDFTRDFTTDILPFVERHYRVRRDRGHRAIAGLSMGGNQALTIAVANLRQFAWLGVFSSGLIQGFTRPRPERAGAAADAAAPPPGQLTSAGEAWIAANRAALDDARMKKDLRLVWFATGRDDFLMTTTRATVALLEQHGFRVMIQESGGGHTWINWRNYLQEFVPLLFRQIRRLEAKARDQHDLSFGEPRHRRGEQLRETTFLFGERRAQHDQELPFGRKWRAA
jgi:enterochelin esterase family protein